MEDLWNEEVAKEEKILQDSLIERHFGPARRWPGYAIQKARVMRKAQELLERRQGAKKTGSTQAEKFTKHMKDG